ncbi:MAG: DUF4105 domain-containing protein [Paludibacteraceae bacterium]|nr:DUF4105 domain-containing protein [Paludibacteraceae bacterium]
MMMHRLFTMGTAWMLSLCAVIAAPRLQPILSDRAEISLLTCSPGDEIYELFGHTGIHVYDPEAFDVVVNYGLFDFDQENFIGRFVKGQTDYCVGSSNTYWFLRSYEQRGSSVTEARLHLTQEQKQQLWDFLLWNLQPENREYRYNFIFNNCATQPRDLIFKALSGHLQWTDGPSEYTFRDAIRCYTRQADWSQLGFDICLGAGTDRIATRQELMFLPEKLNEAFGQMQITDETGRTVPLTDTPQVLFEATRIPQAAPCTPKAVACTLFLVLLTLSVLSYVRNRPMRGIDAALFSVAGTAGLIVCFLMGWSEHPFTGSNWNIVWLNPLYFYPLCSLCIPPLRKMDKWFYRIVCALLTVFLIAMPFLPQSFHPSMSMWVGCLWLRAAYRTLLDYRPYTGAVRG